MTLLSVWSLGKLSGGPLGGPLGDQFGGLNGWPDLENIS